MQAIVECLLPWNSLLPILGASEALVNTATYRLQRARMALVCDIATRFAILWAVSKVGRGTGSLSSRGAKTSRLLRPLQKSRGQSLNPKTIIHITILDSNHHHHGDWISSPLYRKHWSQIYVKYINIY